MMMVTSDEKLEPVSSTQEAPIHSFGAKAPHKTFVRQSKFAVAGKSLAKNDVWAILASNWLGNQTKPVRRNTTQLLGAAIPVRNLPLRE